MASIIEPDIDSYIDSYLFPFLERYGGFTCLWSIDLVTEPDWATIDEGGTLTCRSMKIAGHHGA